MIWTILESTLLKNWREGRTMGIRRRYQWPTILLTVIITSLWFSCTVFAVNEVDTHLQDPITVRASDGSETGYPTLFEAADAAKDGDTILLNQNIEMAFFDRNGSRQKPTMMVENKTLTLDGQNHTVTAKNEAFSMIEVRPGGKLTIQNIVLDGSAADNRRFSNIVNVEGGELFLENGSVLTNNCTAAVGIGTNVPGGSCTMNGGSITGNIMPAGSNDTGVAVTVLEGSTFILNGGTISDNQALRYGCSGIMVNRGGMAILNGGTITGNTTAVAGMASAVHIKGGRVELSGTEIQNNTSANGYGAIYVTNHSSFGEKWDGVLDISGGSITGNTDADGTSNAIYLWSRSSIEGTGAYLYFSGSPKIEGASRIYANGSSSVAFQPAVVDGAFTPVVPVEFDLLFDYVVGQTIVEYTDGVPADSTHFIAAREEYGFQKDTENNLLYTEAKRKVIFMDGDTPCDALTYWEFVEATVKAPGDGLPIKDGYVIEGWYSDDTLNEKWDFANDVIARESSDFFLHGKWIAAPSEPSDPGTDDNQGDSSESVSTGSTAASGDTENPPTRDFGALGFKLALLFAGAGSVGIVALLKQKRRVK